MIASHVTLNQRTRKPNRKSPLPPQCSTTCGIGARWRTVVCSSPEDGDCASLKRPEPARTCHLQPCATWHSGSWSKVSNVRYPPVTESDGHTLILRYNSAYHPLLFHVSSVLTRRVFFGAFYRGAMSSTVSGFLRGGGPEAP